MRFKRSAAALAITCWLMIFVSPPASRCAAAEALLVYDIKTNDSFTGEKEAVMKTAFTPGQCTWISKPGSSAAG
jgi:hypothetical protein